MISMEFKDPQNEQVKEFLRRKGRKIQRSVFVEMKKIGIDLQSYVKEFKLRGGNPLHSRTGNLSRSIVQRLEEQGTSITAIVGAAPNAPYARIHEFGGTIHIPEVKNTLMVFTPKGGKTVFTMGHRAFDVQMPERSFLRSALEEKREQFRLRINEAVAAGAR